MPKYNLHLKGYVGASDFNRNTVDRCLADNSDNDVRVLIDSTGGSLQTALSIAAAFKNHGAVDVHFVGLNASAATVASLGARTITMDRNAMYLVHKCSNLVYALDSMNADELEQYIQLLVKNKADLDKIDDNIAAMYASRCKKDKKDLINLMKEGAWLNSKEALDWGFIDSITDDEDSSEVIITASLADDFKAAGIPLPGKVVKPHSAISSILSAICDFFSAGRTNQNHSADEPAQEPEVQQPEASETTEVENNQDPEPDDDGTTHVIEQGASGSSGTMDDYIQTTQSARSLFNSLP